MFQVVFDSNIKECPTFKQAKSFAAGIRTYYYIIDRSVNEICWSTDDDILKKLSNETN